MSNKSQVENFMLFLSLNNNNIHHNLWSAHHVAGLGLGAVYTALMALQQPYKG